MDADNSCQHVTSVHCYTRCWDSSALHLPCRESGREDKPGTGKTDRERGVYESDLKSCANVFQEGLLREELLDVVNQLLTRVSRVIIPLV